MSRSFAARTAAAAVLMLLLFGLGHSDDTPAKDKDKDNPDEKKPMKATSRPTKLVILVEAKAEHTPEKVMKTLKVGADKASCRYEGTPDIRATPAAFFRMLRRLDGQPEVKEGKEKQKVTMRPSLDEPTNWLIRINEPEDGRLKSLKVTYFVAGGKKEEKTYEPKNPDKFPMFPLQQTLPRTYVLLQGNDKSVGKDDLPISFEAEVIRISAPDKPLPAIRGTVETGPRYFMVTFTNFEGELSKLFEVIKDGKKVANPVEDAKEDEALSLVFASWHRRLPPTEEFDGFIHKPRFLKLEKRHVVRVWIRFPLTKKGAEEELETYRKMDETTLVRKIREDKPERGRAPLTIGASTKPRWIELPDASGSTTDGKPRLEYFSRDIVLRNFDDLRRDYPDAHRLVVYEFEPEGGQPDQGVEAIEVPDPVTKKGVYVLAQPVAGWKERLDRLQEQAKVLKGKPPGKDK